MNTNTAHNDNDFDTAADREELGSMRLAFQAMVRRWGLGGRDLAALLPAGGEDRPAPPADTERRMRLLLDVGDRLPRNFECGRLAGWLWRPLPDLGGMTPMQVMADGPAGIRALRDWLSGRFA